MSLKTKIKNDLWHINYILPFTVKYLQEGKLNYFKQALPVVTRLRVIKGDGKRDISSDIKALMEQVKLGVVDSTSFFYWLDTNRTIAVKGNVLSNFTLDYKRVLERPFNEIADEAVKAGGNYGKRAAVIKESVHILRNRIIQIINTECMDTAKQKRLNEEFFVLLEKPASHFHEGLQRILFFNQILWQTRHMLNGLGRLDKILGALYESDINDGYMSKEEAYNYICDFLKLLHKWYIDKSSALLGDVGQIILLGGIEDNGTYFCNDLTYMFLKAQAEVAQSDPKILLRVSCKMPRELLRAATEALTAKTGSPLFSNDDVVLPSLKKFGISHEDAASYCVSACWEPFIPGKSLDQNNICSFDFFKPLDTLLNELDGKSPENFTELVKMYDISLRNEWKRLLKTLDEYIWAADPLVSILTDGCNESGKDISEGGGIYNNYGVTSVGLGSACDTLLNIKKLVYLDQKYTLEELNKHRKENFKSASKLLEQLKKLHHYAHDDVPAVKLVNHIISVTNKELDNYTNLLGGRVKFGLSSPNYIKAAKGMPADLAGRLAGMPYGTHISCTDVSYTEVINFAGKLNYSGYCFNGNVVDYFVSPGLIENNLDKLVLFMKAAIDAGFFQMQMNIMDSATLIDAKTHPEKYPGLIVRVWGFSAYFNDLPEDYKDLLIERALQSEE